MKCRACLVACWLFLGAAVRCFSQEVVINEIMYRPLVPGIGQKEEWIELHNPGTAEVNLLGWRLVDGVDFAFTNETVIPPGGYLVVCADVATFQTIYPTVANVIGGWTGFLNNNGEGIELADAAGQRVDRVRYASEGEWAVRRRGILDPYGYRGWRWFAEHDGIGKSLELINPNMPSEHAQNWASSVPSGGTPGAQNSTYASNIAPLILELQQFPIVPRSTETVTITAHLLDEADSGVTAQVWWRTAFTGFTPVDMFDDGAHNDGSGGDGIYGAILPTQVGGTVVEFYVAAQDSGSRTRTFPAPAIDELGNFYQAANALYQVDDSPPYAGSQPFYRIIMTEAERQEFQGINRQSDAQMNMTFVTIDSVETQVRHRCGVRIRGASSRGRNPPNYRVNIPNDRKWKEFDEINLNTQYTHAQLVASAVAKKAGIPVAGARVVQVRVNGNNLAGAGSPQFGSYVMVESMNADWAKIQFPTDPDGNIYRQSSGAHTADLNYLGTDPNAYFNAGYNKVSNQTENDWSDLINLTRVLNTTPAAGYSNAVSQVVNVRQWLRHIGVLSLMEYSETAIASGEGDDYSMYRGIHDPRFVLMGHDFDTVFGQGDTGGNVMEDIFLAADFDQPAVRTLMHFPPFTRIYYEELNSLLNTTFSAEQLFPLFDRLLRGFAPEGTIENMKAFATNRANYVRSRIYSNLTVNTNLPVVSGYLQAPGSTVNLSGRANVTETHSVLVNGNAAGWDAVSGLWSATNVALLPGVNRVLVQSLNGSGAEFQRAHVDVFYNVGTSNVVGGLVENNTTWSAASGPYWITESLIVESGATLTIEPGTTVYLNPNLSIEIQGAARLLAEGTPTRRIRFTRPPGSTGRWGEIYFVNNPVESRLVNVDIEHSGAAGRSIRANNSILYLDGLSFANTAGGFCSIDNSAFNVRNSVFPSTTAAEPIHGTGIRAGGYAIIEGNTFGTTTGLNDIIDFTGGQRPGPILQVLNNTFTGASDDVLDLDGCDAHVEGNVFMNVHQETAGGDTASAVSGGADSGNTSEITIVRNFFFDCDHAVLAKEGNFYTIVNNTMVSMTRAAVNFDEPLRRGQGVTPGRGAQLDGNIMWHTRSNFANVYVEDPTFGSTELSMYRSIISGADFAAGPGNLRVDPLLVNTNFATITARSIRADFSLRPGSLAAHAGPNGLDMGAAVPAGASIAGEPPSNTYFTSATLTVDGPGITHYRYSVNGGTYGDETAIGTPINLTGLTSGAYTVAVLGKNSAGVYQVTPTLSGTWTVETGTGNVRLNEILARNQSAVPIATQFPDLIELFNSGSDPVDLSGMTISDDLADPKKFTFPQDAILGSGQHLVLYAADSGSGPGFWLGFGLNQNGDGVYLFNADSSLRDSIEFGIQISDYSIGRLTDGTWSLTRPTFGGANVLQPAASPEQVKINEWLALGGTLYVEDFVELYNPNPVPASVGGSYLTDAPGGSPLLHRIADLSYLPPFGLFAFMADGLTNAGAEHLNFRLSADQGEVALLSPEGVLIDCIGYLAQSPDVSEGRRPNGSADFGRISPPTPGSPNPGRGGIIVTNITIGLLPLATNWNYNATGQEPPASWRDPGFDDSAWPSGDALLAWETCNNCLPNPPGINTTLSLNDSTGSQIITYYFRKAFVVNTNTAGFRLTMNLVLDDGAVVYLNGNEVLRVRLPGGTINYFTQSSPTIQDASIETYELANATLLSGTNVIAVEVHQGGLPSSDVAFGLSLAATKTIVSSNTFPINLNEVIANNVSFTNNGKVTDWVEIFNSSESITDLGGMSLSDDEQEPRRWVFPSGSLIFPGDYLIVHCDGDSPASTNASGVLNTGFGLKTSGDRLYFFDTTENGSALIDAIAFGIQTPDFSLARFPDGIGPWALALPTPGSVNIAAALGSPANLRINEWLANPSGNDEDFFELYNPNAQPVDLSGLYLTDDLSRRTQLKIADLSFVGFGEQGFVRFVADGDISKGADHVNFRLAAGGESIGLYTAGSVPIDTITFERQENGVSEGRFPDGSANTNRFPGTSTPGASNMRQLTEVVINEVLTHTDPPLEDAIELFNPTSGSVDLSGWYLSDRKNEPKKFRIPDGTVIEPGGYVTFYETNFNSQPGIYPSFALSSSKGDELYLFTTDQAGNLSGYRNSVKFGAAANGVSFGRYETSTGIDFPALSQLTFGGTTNSLAEFRMGKGAANAYPLVGPIVINEIMYRPPDIGTNDNDIDEFIELRNISAVSVPLFDPGFPTNTWRLRDAVDFDFPQSVTLGGGSYLLVVSFDPATNAAALSAFRTRYGLAEGVPIFGPHKGKLANDSENLELYRPDGPIQSGPDTGFVPYIEVDKVKYSDSHPWPGAADGNTNGIGASLQRRVGHEYGNDPVNWLAGNPTAGGPTGAAVAEAPSIDMPPQSQTVSAGTGVSFSVVADGAAPLRYQWRFNGNNIAGATNVSFAIASAQLTNSGRYAVLVANSAGAVLSLPALLTVQAPPRITRHPEPRGVPPGGTAIFSVTAEGTPPLSYQWKFNGQDLSGETNAALVVSNVQVAKEGNYTVMVVNEFGSVTSDAANLAISAAPFIITQPVGTNVFVGAAVTFRVVANGSPPLRYQWRFNNADIPGATGPTFTIPSVQLTHAGNYSVRVTNNVDGVLSEDARLVVTVPPQVSVVATDPTAGEIGGNTGRVTFARTGTLTDPLTVHFSLNGSAVYGADYDMASSPVTIPAGLNSVAVDISAINDAEREANETVIVRIAPAPEYSISASAGSATASIIDNDNLLPTVSITSPADNARFPLPTNIAITASATDSDGPINRVEFYSNGTNKIGEALTTPYEVGWSNPPAGLHTVTAIAIDDVGGSSISAPVRITFVAPGFGDMFEDRGILGGFTNFVTGANNSAYTRQPGEPRHHHNGAGNGNKSAWLSWVAPLSGLVTMSTVGSSFDTILVVYTNSPSNIQTVSNLVKIASNDDRNGSTLQSEVSFQCRAGVAYQIAVDGYNVSSFGSLTFRLGLPNPIPVITTQPQSQIANLGATVTFSVAASSSTPLTYQWRYNSVDIPNATGSSLVLTNVQQSHAGSYTVVVRNSAGSVMSSQAALTLRFPPTIVTPLANAVVNVGSNVVFSVAVNGTTPFTFQWRFNGAIIPGVSGATLARSNIQYTNGGVYAVTVANPAGTTSSQAEMIVRPRVLPASSFTNGGFLVKYLGTPGKAYDILYSTNLVDWSEIGAVTNQAIQGELLDVPGNDPNRAYRLRVRP